MKRMLLPPHHYVKRRVASPRQTDFVSVSMLSIIVALVSIISNRNTTLVVFTTIIRNESISSRNAAANISSRSVQGGEASWDNFDRIVCLNVRERPDRLAHAKEQFERVGILDKVQFRIENRHTRGCEKAHWRAIKEAYDDGLENLVIFEDDVVFKTGWQDVINDCNAFVKQEPDWEFLNMEGTILYYVENVSPVTPFSMANPPYHTP